MKVKLAVVILLTAFIFSNISAQEIKETDKVTTVNIMIGTIYSTRLGYIIEYYWADKLRELYVPNAFFENRTVVKVYEDNEQISPQMNIVFKNGEAFKIKLYVPNNPNGLNYQVLQTLPDDKAQIFNNTKKLEVSLTNDKAAQQQTPAK
jgi:hypothetical protein